MKYGPVWPTTCAALVGDGVRREHEVDLALLEERLAVVGDRLLVSTVDVSLGVDAEVGDEELGDLDVEAGRDVVRRRP